ncbi:MULTISPECIES: hypothetical protein [unclassified Halomonas]|uniref:hypothetical protein n=1 Tax=unclassified Halomonas TaxID=2609666 RepID=UPI00131B5F27|nr:MULTISPECIES: hypothetical protein [unclassified Halomonas]
MSQLLHTNLGNKLQNASLFAQKEKIRMLLNHLVLYEKELSLVLELSENDAQEAAINT